MCASPPVQSYLNFFGPLSRTVDALLSYGGLKRVANQSELIAKWQAVVATHLSENLPPRPSEPVAVAIRSAREASSGRSRKLCDSLHTLTSEELKTDQLQFAAGQHLVAHDLAVSLYRDYITSGRAEVLAECRLHIHEHACSLKVILARWRWRMLLSR